MDKSTPSRTKHVTQNALWSCSLQVLTLVFQFASRTIFINTLGKDYLGISELFYNVLMFVSFAELGIGNAIVYCMYKPLAENDHATLMSLMNFYKKAYRIIALVIALIGLACIPLLPYVIKDAPNIRESLTLIYLLYLFNTVSSYFFTYNKSIITADQKDYIVILYYKGFYFLQVILQIFTLLLTHNFIIYLLMQILCTFLNNFLISKKAKRMYPYITVPNPPQLPDAKRRVIVENVKSLVVYRISDISLNSIANILISMIFGIQSVALCSNYLLIESSLNQIIKLVINSFNASIGNLNTGDDLDKSRRVFNAVYMITAWLYGFLAVGIAVMSTPLIHLWFGDSYIVGQAIVITIALRTYITGIQYVPFTYRTTMGLLQEKRFVPLLAAILNLGLSVLFAYIMGLPGIFVATFISRLVTTTIVDMLIVCKKGFKQSPWPMFKHTGAYFILLVFAFGITYMTVSNVMIVGIWGFVVKFIVCTVVCNAVYFLVLFKTSAFKTFWQCVVNAFPRMSFKNRMKKD